MKTLLIFLLSACALFAVQNVSAQSTKPRFGTVGASGNNTGDNSGRSLNYTYKAATDAAGADTVLVNTPSWESVYKITMTDSLSLSPLSVTQCYFGDRLTCVVTGASGNKLKFIGTKFIASSDLTLTTKGKAVITFIFDGAAWREAYRVSQ